MNNESLVRSHKNQRAKDDKMKIKLVNNVKKSDSIRKGPSLVDIRLAEAISLDLYKKGSLNK